MSSLMMVSDSDEEAPVPKKREAVTVKGSKVKIKLQGTAPHEAYQALCRYLDLVNPLLEANREGLTMATVWLYQSAALVLDIYEEQVVPQMRLDELPEELKLTLSRTEALHLWSLMQTDRMSVAGQSQWVKALNEVHQKLS